MQHQSQEFWFSLTVRTFFSNLFEIQLLNYSIHNIVLKFTYVPATGDNGGIICIQPNRGLDTTVEGKIFDLSLKK